MMIRSVPRHSGSNSGSILVHALVIVLFLAGLSVGVIAVHHQDATTARAQNQAIRLRHVAEGGLSEAVLRLTEGKAGAIGDAANPAFLGNSPYFVREFELGGGMTRLISTAIDGGVQVSMEALVEQASGDSPLGLGISAKDSIWLMSNVMVDSYDSSLGSYLSQVHGGVAGSHARVISNGIVGIRSNTDVHGEVVYGADPLDVAIVAGGASVSGGQSQASEEIVYPAVSVPSLSSTGDYSVHSGTDRVGPGDFRFDDVEVRGGATLEIEGPARIVVDSFTLYGRGSFHVDASGGEVEFIVKEDFNLRSNSNISTQSKDASQVKVSLLATHTTELDSSPVVDLNSNGNFVGSLYAPDARVTVNSNFEMFGALAARWVRLDSNTQFHFDEVLGAGPGTGAPSVTVVAWRSLSSQQAKALGVAVSP